MIRDMIVLLIIFGLITAFYCAMPYQPSANSQYVLEKTK